MLAPRGIFVNMTTMRQAVALALPLACPLPQLPQLGDGLKGCQAIHLQSGQFLQEGVLGPWEG